MKNLSLLFFVFLLIQFASLAQEGWFQQNSGTSESLGHVDFVNENVGWAGGYWIIIKTTDGGANWNPILQWPQTNTHIVSFDFVDSSKGWLLIYDYESLHIKIHNTTDGGITWIPQFTATQFELYWDMQFIDELNGWCIGDDLVYPKILRTTDGGINWIEIYIDTLNWPELYSLDFVNPDIGWAAGEALYKTTDAGLSWTSLNTTPFPGIITFIQFVNTEVGWCTNEFALYKSTDEGNNWTEQFIHGTGGWYPSPIFFTDTLNGWIAFANLIYHTVNGGADWSYQTSNTTNTLNHIYFVDEYIGWIVGGDGTILHTTNGGLPVELFSFSVEVIDNDVILNWTTATETNNFGFEIERKTVNYHWERIGFVDGHGTTIEPQFYSYVDETVASGIYKYRLKQTDYDGSFEYSEIIEVEVGILTQFSLAQNYPNPFNPSTKIKYSVPQSSNVIIKVFDILGNEIETLVDEEKSVGTYEINWHAERLPSGVYFYRLQAGSFVTLKVYDVLGNEIAILLKEEKAIGNYEIDFDAKGLPSGIYFYRLQAGDFVETKKMILIK
jgi:photosystem II stability/assembly factor-like uncharacterized protein